MVKEIVKNVIILGASTKPERYSNKAIHALNQKGHNTILVGRPIGESVNGSLILGSLADISSDQEIDTITVYLSEKNQNGYEDEILALNPKRVIFNPGAENFDLYKKLKDGQIEAINACTLVMLSVGTF